jgi:putative ABC transport system substrate-binding protein
MWDDQPAYSKGVIFEAKGEAMFNPIKTTMTFAVVIALTMLSLPLTLQAQEAKKPARIGMLRSSSPPPAHVQAFQNRLKELGHVEGRTYVLVPAWVRGSGKKLRALARDLAGKVDVIVTEGTRITRAAGAVKPSVPVVFTSSGAPVEAGLVHSLSRPGGNVTGISGMAVELTAKRNQILKELVPGIRRIGALNLRRGGRSVSSLMKAADKHSADALGVEFVYLIGRNVEELIAAFDGAASAGIGAMSVRSLPYLNKEARKRLVEAFARNKIPAIYGSRSLAQMGGLIAFGPNRAAMYRRAATYVDKILKGARPADLPVDRPTKFDLVINLKTAKALGITFPRSILLRATEVIE